MLKKDLLGFLNFGSVDSESERNLDKIFIQTTNFNEFVNSNNILFLGSKGSGKSALYRLFTDFKETAISMANHAVDNVYLLSGIGFKDVSETDDIQILNKIEDGTISSESAWKVYIMYKIVFSLYDDYKIICGDKSRKILKDSKRIKDKRVFGLFKLLFNKFIADSPKISKIDFKNICVKFDNRNELKVEDVLKEVESYLIKNDKSVWLLLDKIDELFSNLFTIRKNCIEGLFTAYIDLSSRYKHIKLKIFLRTDIWRTLSFVNKSHLTDKTTTINWEENSLKHLLIKRAIYDNNIREFIISKVGEIDEDSVDSINKCFNVLFPKSVYKGVREAKTIAWIIERCKDGLGGVYPREIINFGNYSVEEEIEYLKNNEEFNVDSQNLAYLIEGRSIKNAFNKVSSIKVSSYLSEFRDLSEHFNRFSGQTTAKFTQSELITLMEGLIPNGEDMIKQLYETGVISYSSGSILTSTASIIVPRLFRSGLGIVTSGRP